MTRDSNQAPDRFPLEGLRTPDAAGRAVGMRAGRWSRDPQRAVVCMGRPARRVFMAGRGSVLAAFASTLYLESKAGIACIAPPPAPCGPLNVVMPGIVLPAAMDLDGAAWRAGA